MKIEFKVVDNLPPKKDGANSMWNKRSEFQRIVALRSSAKRAMQGRKPFEDRISLKVDLHVLEAEIKSAGDLDNFITGVCDGLMAAGSTAKLYPLWSMPEHQEIYPSKTIAIADDSAVLSISARKKVSATGKRWYRVILEGD